jgi:hypothetical protein
VKSSTYEREDTKIFDLKELIGKIFCIKDLAGADNAPAVPKLNNLSYLKAIELG